MSVEISRVAEEGILVLRSSSIRALTDLTVSRASLAREAGVYLA